MLSFLHALTHLHQMYEEFEESRQDIKVLRAAVFSYMRYGTLGVDENHIRHVLGFGDRE